MPKQQAKITLALSLTLAVGLVIWEGCSGDPVVTPGPSAKPAAITSSDPLDGLSQEERAEAFEAPWTTSR